MTEIFVVYDAEFSNTYPDEQAEIDDIMNMVEGYYYHEWNLLVDFDWFGYEECENCTSTHYSPLIEELKDTWKDNTTLDRDLIHLFSGKDLEPGGVVGAGIEPGINNETHGAYSLSQHIDLSDYERSIVVAHEIGHNFYGREDLAEKWWNPQTQPQRWEYTIMWSPLYVNDPYNHPYPFFSDGTRTTNSTKNNLKWMIPFACKHLPKD